jgi:hypothetical protein
MDTDYSHTDGNKVMKYLTWTFSPGELKKENHNTGKINLKNKEKYSINFKQKMINAYICVT